VKILFTGPYDPTNSRVRVLGTGLRANSVSLIESPYPDRRAFDPTGFLQGSQLFKFVFLPSGTAPDLRYIKRKLKRLVLFDATPVNGQVTVFNAQHDRSGRFGNGIRMALRHADHILAPSEEYSAFLCSAYSLDKKKITIIPPGTEINHFMPALHPVRKAKLKIGQFIREAYMPDLSLLSAGLKLFAEYHTFHMVFVVENENLLAKLKEFSSKLPCQSTVSQLPAWDKLPELINEFDICLGSFPGDSAELSPFPDLFHYLACGKPVLTQENTVTLEFFKSGEHLATCPPDPQLFAGQLERLMQDDPYRRLLAAEGMRLVRDNFNEQIMARLFTDLAARFQA